MASCSVCHADIDNEQHWTYFSCCPACYNKLKARKPKILFPLGAVYMALGITAMILAVSGVILDTRLVRICIVVGFSFSFSGASTLYRAWRWKTTVVVRDTYNYKILAIQTMITTGLLLIVMAIPIR